MFGSSNMVMNSENMVMNSENMEMSEYVWYSCLELVIRGIWSSCMVLWSANQCLQRPLINVYKGTHLSSLTRHPYNANEALMKQK